jgi:hypothetical protein
MGSLLWSRLTALYLIVALAVIALILGMVVSPAWLWPLVVLVPHFGSYPAGIAATPDRRRPLIAAR